MRLIQFSQLLLRLSQVCVRSAGPQKILHRCPAQDLLYWLASPSLSFIFRNELCLCVFIIHPFVYLLFTCIVILSLKNEFVIGSFS